MNARIAPFAAIVTFVAALLFVGIVMCAALADVIEVFAMLASEAPGPVIGSRLLTAACLFTISALTLRVILPEGN